MSSLRLLGPIDVYHLQAASLSVKQLGLLAIVADKSPRPLPRSYLGGLLWPSSSNQSARHSLSQALYSIRRGVGEGVLEADAAEIALGAIDCDLITFHEYLAQGAYDEAAELIRGEFCERLVIPGCVEFDQWLENARHTYRQRVVQLLDEPLAPDLRNRLHQIIKGKPYDRSQEDSGSELSSPHFVGRVAERDKLERALNRSKGGEVITALVTGEPGIGKTALCTRVVKKSVLHGSRALLASAFEVQRNLPYGIISQLLNGAYRAGLLKGAAPPWLSVLGTLIPIAQLSEAPRSYNVPDGGESYRFAGAVHHILHHVAQSSPVTLFVDDVQWADAASMSILHYVAHSETDLPLFILFAARNRGLDFFQNDRWEFSTSLSLRGLSLEETKLVLRPSTSYEEPEVESIQHVTGGNPLLVHALSNRNATYKRDLPAGVREYFRHELARLSGKARLIGAALSAADEPLSASRLAWLADIEAEAADLAIGELMDEGFVEPIHDDDVFTLRHGAIRDVFLSSLSPVSSAKLHGRLAKSLRDQGRPAAMIATQLTIAGNQAETCEFAVQAARASARLYAYREAEYFYRIAIQTAPSAILELESRIALSTLFRQQHMASEAKAMLRQFEHVDRLSKEKVALLEANIHIAEVTEVGPRSVAIQAFERADAIRSMLPPNVQAQLYTGIALNAQHGLPDLLERSALRAIEAVHSMPVGPEKIQLEVTLSALRALNIFNTANLEQLDRLTEQSSDWPTTYAACLSASGLVRVARGMVADAEDRFLKALQVCEQYGLLNQRIKVLNNLGVCYLEQGRWLEAQQQFTGVVRAGGAVAPKTVPGAASNLLILQYEQGYYEDALEWGRRCLKELPPQTRLRLGILSILGLIYMERGQLLKAREIEKLIRDKPERDVGWSNDISYVEIFAARMSAIDGEVAAAERRLTQKIEEFVDRDFYCMSRMKVELIRSIASHSPYRALEDAESLRPLLSKAQAVPLVERVDRIVSRCRNRLDLTSRSF